MSIHKEETPFGETSITNYNNMYRMVDPWSRAPKLLYSLRLGVVELPPMATSFLEAQLLEAPVNRLHKRQRCWLLLVCHVVTSVHRAQASIPENYP